MSQTTLTERTDASDGDFTTLDEMLNDGGMAQEHDPGGQRDLDLDDILEVLQNERRRVALDVLADANQPVRKADLADAVADRLGDADDKDFRKTIYVTLHQNHLKTLKKYDVVREADDDVYVLGPTADQVLDVKERIDQQDAAADAVGNALGRIASRFR